MSQRETSDYQVFRPSRRVIAPRDQYGKDDFLRGPDNQQVPEVCRPLPLFRLLCYGNGSLTYTLDLPLLPSSVIITPVIYDPS